MRRTLPCVRAPLFHPPATASLHPPITAWLDELVPSASLAALSLDPPSLVDSSLDVALSLEVLSVEPSLDALQTLSLADSSLETPSLESPVEASLEQTLLEESSANVTESSRWLSTG